MHCIMPMPSLLQAQRVRIASGPGHSEVAGGWFRPVDKHGAHSQEVNLVKTHLSAVHMRVHIMLSGGEWPAVQTNVSVAVLP